MRKARSWPFGTGNTMCGDSSSIRKVCSRPRGSGCFAIGCPAPGKEWAGRDNIGNNCRIVPLSFYVLFFCLPHKRPGAPARRKKKRQPFSGISRKSHLIVLPFASQRDKNSGLRNSPALAGSDSLRPFPVFIPFHGGKTNGAGIRAAAFASEQPRKGRNTMPDALRPFRGVKRAKRTIRPARLFSLPLSFEPAKESGVRARTGR